ncbi:hypothetical protein AB3I32_08965 [Enterococcus sp. C33]|uniref:hypothetical protein n=1 Tax=Bacillota TaxID=1239 RepID=UPI0015733E92|nr:hypothetical protein [Enterococcus faecalis]HCT6703156.1 hypothetical protein [Enterococcus faecalis]HCT6705172.1 hypothetical protein [Enterococcus faecalis]
MDRLKELKEAKVAAQEVIARIDNAISSLNSASSWGIADLLGGGAFSSFLKRGKIKDANSDIKEISRSLNLLNKELEDVNMHLPTEVSDTISDNVFDVCFDNIYTDFKVQEEIKEGLNGLKDFRTYVVELIEKLNYEIETFK